MFSCGCCIARFATGFAYVANSSAFCRLKSRRITGPVVPDQDAVDNYRQLNTSKKERSNASESSEKNIPNQKEEKKKHWGYIGSRISQVLGTAVLMATLYGLQAGTLAVAAMVTNPVGFVSILIGAVLLGSTLMVFGGMEGMAIIMNFGQKMGEWLAS
jgi:hypothetical protein